LRKRDKERFTPNVLVPKWGRSFGARQRQPVVKPHKYQTKTATAQASAKKKNLVPA